MLKKVIVLGVLMGVASLGEHALAQALKSPDAVPAQMQAESNPAPDGLVTLLEAKGVLTEAEAALVSQTQQLPETRQVLAEMLLAKHLISRKEYDRTLRACSTSGAPAKTASERSASSILGPNRNSEAGGRKSLSDWMAWILPGGGQTTDLDFGTIQPGRAWSPGGQPQHARAEAKRKSHQDHGCRRRETEPLSPVSSKCP